MKIKKILVSQPKPETEKSPYWEIAKNHKVDFEFFKFFKIEGISVKDFRQSKVNILEYSAILLTSKNAVDHFFRIAKEMRITVPETMKYFCVSDTIAFYLQNYVQYRKRKIFHGKQSMLDLVPTLKKHKEDRFLIPCTDLHNPEMTQALDDLQINYTKAVFYQTVSSDLSTISLQEYDLIVLFSPSGVTSLYHNFPNFKQNEMAIATFGSTTSKAAKEHGLELAIEAPSVKAPSMTMAIDQYLEEQKKKCKEKK